MLCARSAEVAAMAAESGFSARGLGEIVLRVRDLDAMIAFYRRALGLELLRRISDDIAFLRVAEGFGGHTQILGFFRDRQPSNFRRREWAGHDPARTTLHHFALEIARDQYESALAHLERQGIATDTAVHAWIGWRSIYFRDPEDNTVELVCFDPAIPIAPPSPQDWRRKSRR
jgi:catechol 2,3-dioxygenase-like lactoylglutathione lyase family enzyme